MIGGVQHRYEQSKPLLEDLGQQTRVIGQSGEAVKSQITLQSCHEHQHGGTGRGT